MRKYTVALLFILLSINSKGQVNDPVAWNFGYEKKGGSAYEIIFNASIEDGWHIYSIDVPKNGPIATVFRFDSIPGVTFEGKPFEPVAAEEKFDEAFGFKIKTFSKNAQFRQKIVAKNMPVTIKGTLTYGACNNSTCTPPQDVDFTVEVGETVKQSVVLAPSTPVSGSKGLLSFFLGSFLLGLLGVITPCVYPMIPMTVAFFSRGVENRSKAVMNAIVFGLSIVVIYTSPGLIISLTGAGAGFANTLSTHWLPNVIFFLLFVLFASSFFGAFEIVLPGKWSSSTDSRVDKGGILGAFFMALTTVIVSFSCTGPIVASLLVEASRGDVLRPTLGMFAFGLAFALPFTIFALFPAVLSKLPKSGGWLNSVKVVLAFLMLAFSMKFLMTIDSVYNLKILTRDIYLSVWIVIFTLTGLYLLGKIKFSHDSDVQHIGVFRLLLVIIVFSFVVYLIPGMFGSPLKGISSLLPSQGTSELNIPAMINSNGNRTIQVNDQAVAKSQLCSTPKFGDIFEMPLGLTGYYELKQGLSCAKEQGKPVFLDFKGHACANCKLMEAKVFSDPRVLERLRNKFVIIALYADDRTELPESEWVKSTIDGKLKKTIGKVNEDIEISMFGSNALPLYVITDYNGKPLNNPMPTNLNVDEYIKWLDEGYSKFKNE